MTGKDAPREIYSRLARYHGVEEIDASYRIHQIKDAFHLPADYDLLFGLNGDVYDGVSGEWLGTMTDTKWGFAPR